MVHELQHAPPVVSRHSFATLAKLLEVVEATFNLLNDEHFKKLLEIKASKRYVERLAKGIRQKKDASARILSSTSEIAAKRDRINTEIATVQPKLSVLLEESRTVKKYLESSISRAFKGRPVNIVGDINKLLE